MCGWLHRHHEVSLCCLATASFSLQVVTRLPQLSASSCFAGFHHNTTESPVLIGHDPKAVAWVLSLGSGTLLHQFIEQGAYAVVLLRRASDRFVTHGTYTAHLQPLHQTLPVKGMLAWQHPQLVFHFEVLETDGTRLPMKIQLFWISFQNYLSVAKALTLGLVA